MTDTTTSSNTTSGDGSGTGGIAAAGNAEVQEAFDAATERGMTGWSPAPDAGLQHSLLTGPDSPPLVDGPNTRFPQPTLPQET